MEEKERYEILNDGLIYDSYKKEYLFSPSLLRKEQMIIVCNLLNQQNKRIKELEEENKECKHWENMFHKLSTEEDSAITKVNKSLNNPMALIDDYDKWADYTLEQIKQSQKQLAIKELEELQKEFDYCPYSGDSIYVAEVYDKIFAKIKELKGEIMEEKEGYEVKERKMNQKYKMPEMEEMKSAFNKLAEETKEFLQKYYNPHTKIVADISGIEVVEGVLSKSFELND